MDSWVERAGKVGNLVSACDSFLVLLTPAAMEDYNNEGEDTLVGRRFILSLRTEARGTHHTEGK